MKTASQLYAALRRFQDAYAAALRPLCERTGMAQGAVDILLFLANNPGLDTARDICLYRRLKPGIVSLHVESLARGVSGAAACAGRSPQVRPALHRACTAHHSGGAGAATILHAADCGRHAGGRSGGVPALHSHHGSQSRPHGGGVGAEDEGMGIRGVRYFLASRKYQRTCLVAVKAAGIKLEGRAHIAWQVKA